MENVHNSHNIEAATRASDAGGAHETRPIFDGDQILAAHLADSAGDYREFGYALLTALSLRFELRVVTAAANHHVVIQI